MNVLWIFPSAIALTLTSLIAINADNADDIEAGKAFLEEYNRRAEELTYQQTLLTWAYTTNITDYNQQRMTEAGTKVSYFAREAAENCSQFNWKSFDNELVQRQFEIISKGATAEMPEDESAELDRLKTEMEEIYNKAQVCDGKRCLSLEPDLTRLFANERNWTKLERAWLGWRDATGRKMKKKYERFVELENKVATLEGFSDAGESWRSNYAIDDFEEQIEKLWQTVRPLYQQLHAFVRKRLRLVHKDKEFPQGGHIPAHLLGNMWAQSWINIFPLTKPYPQATAINVTGTLVNKGFKAIDIIKMANDFFVSLGLLPMPDIFWEKSLFEKPTDGRELNCHASAWDFYNGIDFRLLQCTDITQEYLEVTHHELGHLQYFIQYKDQPLVFREGANHGFHEAVGDIMTLSVSTPDHLHKVGLLETLDTNMEADLNFLLSQALDRLAFLPFGYLIDQWRWSVFRGDTTPDKYNYDWWKLRCKYQGLAPPVTRSNDDFDPGAKYHVPANVPYIRYFVSFILQFQFHKALCEIANNTKPLHRCDIYKSKEAGEALGNMLKLGSSVPWPQALKQVTGTEHMNAQPLMEYFQPLYEWLKKENKGEEVGWEESCPPGSVITSAAVKGFHRVSVMLLLILPIITIVT